MGGNALKNTETRRVFKDEYFQIVKSITPLLEKFCSRIEVIPAYKEKESFGDMDVLVLTGYSGSDLILKIKEQLSPNELIKNDKTYSFDYHKLQIDLIVCDVDTIDSSLFYYSYNDLNNLIGRVANKMGLKFGHKGLLLPICDNNYSYELLLTNNPKDIYEFLGYSYERYLKGFDTLNQIFRFATSSLYFSKEPFFNQNHKNRTRNAKRKVFMEFLEWLNHHDQRHIEDFAWNSDKMVYIVNALAVFNKKSEYLEVINKIDKSKKIKTKFNGELVSNVTGLKNKDLGEFINDFKASFASNEHFDEWALSTPLEDIINKIKTF